MLLNNQHTANCFTVIYDCITVEWEMQHEYYRSRIILRIDIHLVILNAGNHPRHLGGTILHSVILRGAKWSRRI